MFMTSALLYIAMREVWGWGLVPSAAVAGALLCVDGAFFSANVVKVLDGGYVPLLLAGLVYAVMWTWHRGASAVTRVAGEALTPVPAFLADIEQRRIPRVPGSAVFITRTLQDTPPVMKWHVQKNRALHQHLLVLTLKVEATTLGSRQRAPGREGTRAEFLAGHRSLRIHGTTGRAHRIAGNRGLGLPAAAG